MTLLCGLEQSGYHRAMEGLSVQQPGDRYSDSQLHLCLVLLAAWGVLRIDHINDQPVGMWGIPLSTRRRPDGDTLDQYVNRLIELDEVHRLSSLSDRLGQIRPGGLIDTAGQVSLRCWAEAGLLEGDVWYFDDHVVEYTGQADMGKTKHGTKHISVKAVNRYTLYNGLCSLSEYFPVSVSYADALRHLVSKANRCLPRAYRIGKLSFDRAGWDADLLRWLEDQQDIVPVTWVKKTSMNVKLLAEIPEEAFVGLSESDEVRIGKEDEHHAVRIADIPVDFPGVGTRRVVVLETEEAQRIGIYTTALHPSQAPLADRRVMTTIGVINAMRFKQRIENRFKVDVHEMVSDAIPTHKTCEVTLRKPYDVDQGEKQRHNAEKRRDKYIAQTQQQQQLLETGQLDKHQFSILDTRTKRLQDKANREIETTTEELDRVQQDENGQAVVHITTQVLDVRKLTVLHLFKTHALVVLKMLANLLGIQEAGPERLRRTFLAFGDRVEFDHDQHIATVYARPFPRAATQQGYERLCRSLYDIPITLPRNGTNYRVRFTW